MSSEPVGRPTVFKPEYVEQARKLCLLGATDKDLADFFEVCEATVNNWKQSSPEFLESIKGGKRVADSEIASKLYERARGAEWVESQAFKVKKVRYKDGKRVSEDEEVVMVPVQRAVPPDTTACIFWLKNRKSSEWRDKQDVEHSGAIKSILVPERIATERSKNDLVPDFGE